jgi:hypothetical protein
MVLSLDDPMPGRVVNHFSNTTVYKIRKYIHFKMRLTL